MNWECQWEVEVAIDLLETEDAIDLNTVALTECLHAVENGKLAGFVFENLGVNDLVQKWCSAVVEGSVSAKRSKTSQAPPPKKFKTSDGCKFLYNKPSQSVATTKDIDSTVVEEVDANKSVATHTSCCCKLILYTFFKYYVYFLDADASIQTDFDYISVSGKRANIIKYHFVDLHYNECY